MLLKCLMQTTTNKYIQRGITTAFPSKKEETFPIRADFEKY